MIHAFKQVRLTNTLLSGSGSALIWGGNQMATQGYVTGVSGALAAAMQGQTAGVGSIAALTGVVLVSGYGDVSVTTVNNTLQISGNTGAYANFVTTSQTGAFVWTGSQQSFTTVIPTGVDATGISYPVQFSSTPKIQSTVEVTGDTMYAITIRQRGITGYTAMFSDTIQESGVVVHTFATL